MSLLETVAVAPVAGLVVVAAGLTFDQGVRGLAMALVPGRAWAALLRRAV